MAARRPSTLMPSWRKAVPVRISWLLLNYDLFALSMQSKQSEGFTIYDGRPAGRDCDARGGGVEL